MTKPKLTPLEELARLCACLRGDNPKQVLSLTDKIISSPSEYMNDPGLSNIWATRGGAFRDLRRASEALICGRKSIEVNPLLWHGYNLAGASCYDLGKFESGDQYFEEAKRRGANKLWIEQFKKKARKAYIAEISDIVQGKWDDSDYNGPFDIDRLHDEHMIIEELADLNESFYRSDEDGWFYNDDDK